METEQVYRVGDRVRMTAEAVRKGLGPASLIKQGITEILGTVTGFARDRYPYILIDGLRSPLCYHPTFWEKLGTGEHMKNPAAVALGRLGGLKGGKARAATLSHEELSAIGRKGAMARWGEKSVTEDRASEGN